MANHLDLEEQEQLDQLKHFWNTWGTLISSVVLVVAGSAAAWNGYQYWQNRQATQAAALFDAVDVAARSGDKTRLEQAFGDLKSKYGSTTQAGQAGLTFAKAMQDTGNADAAKDALGWVAEQSSDDGLKALARLRLASVLMDQKNYDEALKQVSGSFPPEFASVAADRKGDVLLLQDKRQEAIAEFEKAVAIDPRHVKARNNLALAAIDAALKRLADLIHARIAGSRVAETAARIDEVVRDILDRAYARTTQILKDNLDKLHLMADALLQYETIDAKQIDDIMSGREPGPPAEWTKSGRVSKDDAETPGGAIGGPAAQT